LSVGCGAGPEILGRIPVSAKTAEGKSPLQSVGFGGTLNPQKRFVKVGGVWKENRKKEKDPPIHNKRACVEF